MVSKFSSAGATLRLACDDEMTVVYEMGFDIWNGGSNLAEYLDTCRGSTKYKSGKWFVLASADKKLISSALIHDFGKVENVRLMGLGSLATTKPMRRQGYGATMVRVLTEHLLNTDRNTIVFLYSDIGEKFYSRLGYIALSPTLQKYSGESVCMAHCAGELNISILDTHRDWIPEYF